MQPRSDAESRALFDIDSKAYTGGVRTSFTARANDIQNLSKLLSKKGPVESGAPSGNLNT